MASSNDSSPAESVITFNWEREEKTLRSQSDTEHDVLEANLVDSHDSCPDGGIRAWMVVLGGFCCLFCSFGWINCRFGYHIVTITLGESLTTS